MNKDFTENIVSISLGTIFKSVLVLLGIVAAYYLRDILLVVILAVVIATAVEPGARWFIRRRVPRVLAVLLIYSVAIVLMVGAFYFVILPLLNELLIFIRVLPQHLGELQVWNPLQGSGFLGVDEGTITSFSQNFSIEEIADRMSEYVENLSAGFFSAVSSIFGGILSFLLVAVLSFYLSVESSGVRNFLRIVTPSRHEKYVLGLWSRSQHKIGLWMQGQIILGIIVGVLVYLGLTLLGVENALLLAVIAGVFEIIPLFGPIIAAIPAVSIALITNGVSAALIVVGLYVIIQQFENQLIYPLVVRKIVGIQPIVSILSLIIGAKLAGFMGLLIAVPIATMFTEYLSDIEKEKDARDAAAAT